MVYAWFGRFVCVLCMAWAVALAGCSGGATIPGVVPVRGKVTYSGQPVEGARIVFVSSATDGRPAVATSQSDGSYELMTMDSKGALPGSYSVTVKKTENSADLTKTVSMEEAAAPGYQPPPPPKDLLPTKYGDPGQTPLKVDVKAGGGPIDLVLED